MINHVEKYIGTISHGSKSDSGSQYKLNIAAILSSPNSDLKTYITLGLSKHDLNYKSRFEILFVCSLKYDENQIFPFLRWLAETIIENKKILLREKLVSRMVQQAGPEGAVVVSAFLSLSRHGMPPDVPHSRSFPAVSGKRHDHASGSPQPPRKTCSAWARAPLCVW